MVSRGAVLGANSKLNIAGIGVGGKGWTDITSCDSQNIVGLCDIDSNRLAKAKERYPAASTFADWRVMLEKKGKEIDAVTVSTPDHTHFPASLAAIRLGKHVYCQKPLTHTVWEARTLANAARKARVATQIALKQARDQLSDANARLQREVERRTLEVQRVQEVTIMTMASLAETRDNETIHKKRTPGFFTVNQGGDIHMEFGGEEGALHGEEPSAA